MSLASDEGSSTELHRQRAAVTQVLMTQLAADYSGGYGCTLLPVASLDDSFTIISFNTLLSLDLI